MKKPVTPSPASTPRPASQIESVQSVPMHCEPAHPEPVPTPKEQVPVEQGEASAAFTRIHAILQQARSQALAAVNAAMVRAYWDVGREIVEEEQRGKERAGYGQRLLEELAARLTGEFGKGFTPTNLKYMRQFYTAFPIRHTLRDELSWSHYRLLSRIEKTEIRAFYEVEAIKSRWSTREMER